ncbi:toll/interleukin-1 receptor domain-containing protein [Paraburkholderia sp. SIMBA_054]|uniref:toll/interleukin-1 receptor domain-containing protein n=1 Tax=Paraburkholderia sp. SIMBA_054 TaxID=3085795 RepID=UPI003978B916
MKIFLSHHSHHKPLIREFKGMLPSFLLTWLDEESLSWGESVPAELKSTIQSGIDFIIIFLDKKALDSKWVMQELEWAIQREQELKRTFVLPILLEAVASEELPDGISDRLFLRLNNFNRSSIEDLAKSATIKLFQLVVESYSSLQLEVPSRKSLKSIRDELSAGQAKLLGYLVEQGKDGREISQRQIEQGMHQPHASAELFYRLETLIQQAFVRKRRISADGQFSYALTEEFRSQLDIA